MDTISQIAVTENIRKVASGIGGSGLDYVKNALEFIKGTIINKPYNDATVVAERTLRWTRTAEQVLSDGYVYKTKGCTDLVILFQALREAKGYPTNFLRVKDKSGSVNHSMAEVQIDDNWYTVDAGNSFEVKEGKLEDGESFKDFTLWKRGRDGWDIGLKPLT